MTYRILITGSRTWSDLETIAEALDNAIESAPDRKIVVVHGACPTGADHIAAEYCELTADFAERIGKTLVVEPHPAQNHPTEDFGPWPFCGPRRNAHMVNLGADVCLAFIDDCVKPDCPFRYSLGVHGSHGASGCADLADKAGIPVRRFPL